MATLKRSEHRKATTMQATVLNVIMEAYNTGLLQYHTMNIFGITIEMTMHGRMNTVKMTDDRSGKSSYIQVYDSDSPAMQEYSISMVLAEMFR